MIETREKENIFLGYQGEDESRCVVFDIGYIINEFGSDGLFSLTYKRSATEVAYPIPVDAFVLDGQLLKWTVSMTELAIPGKGRVQIRYAVDGVIVKTENFDCIVKPSLGAQVDAPEPMESYIDTMHNIADDTRRNASEADQSADDAERSAERAAQYADASFSSASAAGQSASAASTYANTAYQTSEELKAWVDAVKPTIIGDKGEKGDTGATGPQGPKGDKGDTGATGPQGVQGLQGEQGPQGVPGVSGVYVGSDVPPTGFVVQIDPEGEESAFVYPVAKTADMTQPVGVDTEGKLWTAKSEGTVKSVNGVMPNVAGDVLLTDATLPAEALDVEARNGLAELDSRLSESIIEISNDVSKALGKKNDLSFDVQTSKKGSATAYYWDIASEELKQNRTLDFKLSNYTGEFFQLFKVFLLTASGSSTQVYVNGSGSFPKDTELSYVIDSLKEYKTIRFYVQTTATEVVNPSWDEKIIITAKSRIDEKFESIDIELETMERRFDSPLEGLKIGFLGDSFTEGVTSYGVNYYYGSYISEKTGCNHVNYGVAGSRYTDNNYRDSFWKRTETMDADLDIVCVMGGINDANKRELYTTKLGTIDDPVFTAEQIAEKYNDGTFYQGCKTTIELLLAKYPNAKILMAVPPHVLNASYNPTMNAYDGIETIIGAEIEVAKFYGIPIVNLWDNCTELNNFEANVSAYRQGMTNIHPNRNGHKAMAHYFTNALEQLVMNDYLKD